MTSHASPAIHEYDDPSLDAVGFLLAVMRDTTLSLAIRMDAANKLLPVYRPPPQILHIKITGGLGDLTLAELADYEARRDDGLFAWDLKPRVH
jgi:hypothetical protein